MIYATSSRSGKKTEDALKTMKSGKPFKDLDPAGRRGVDALSRATPRDTGDILLAGLILTMKMAPISLLFFSMATLLVIMVGLKDKIILTRLFNRL